MNPHASTLDTWHAPFRSSPAPTAVFAAITTWVGQAEKFAVTGSSGDVPDINLLLDALRLWRIGFACPPRAVRTGDITAIEVTFNKPHGEGQTTRVLDQAAVAYAALLCSPAGRLALEDHGEHGGYYYLRLYVSGYRLGWQKRRTYFLRLVADTRSDRKTKEPKDFRSVLRRDLSTFEQDPVAEPDRAFYGTEDAKRDSVDRWRELEQQRPTALPTDIKGEDFAALLDRAHKLLGGVPLGSDDEP